MHIFLLIPLYSQPVTLLEEVLSVLSENRDEDAMESLSEKIGELLSEPLDLNMATETTLHSCGLFSLFQVYGILKYRDKYGPFFSIYELASIPGFSQEYLQDIQALLTCESEKSPNQSRSAKGFALSNFSMTLPRSLGYDHTDSMAAYYPGSPVKNSFRIKYEWNGKWSAGAAFERDAGEYWFTNNLPEHLSAYLRYAPGNILKECVIGNFRIHRGLGLVNGTGFSGRSGSMLLNGFRTSFAKPYASTMEYDYYRGMYTELGVKKWKMDFYFSFRPEELSLFNFDSASDLFDKVRSTGLHRTQTEIQGAGLSKINSGGLSFSRSSERWNAGISLSSSRLFLTGRGTDSLKITEPLFSRHSNLSLFGIAFGPSYELYAEYALDQQLRSAFQLGGRIDLNPALALGLNIRKYKPGFTAQYPSTLSTGSSPENETGLQFQCLLTPLKFVRLNINQDISRNIISVDKNISPGYDIRSSILLTIEANKSTRLDIRFSSIMKNKIISDEQAGNGHSIIQNTQRLRIHFSQVISERLAFQSRLETTFLAQAKKTSPASLLFQQISLDLHPSLRLSYRYTIFNVADWDMRIYAYEPGVRYSFSFPAYYGKGSRNLLVLATGIGNAISLRGVCGFTQYAYKRQTGSAYDQRTGKYTLNFEIQFQLDL